MKGTNLVSESWLHMVVIFALGLCYRSTNVPLNQKFMQNANEPSFINICYKNVATTVC